MFSRCSRAPWNPTFHRSRSTWLTELAFLLACSILATSTIAAPHFSQFDGAVRALTVYQGDLIAAGDFIMAGSAEVNHIARWDGLQWQPFGTGTNAPVRALAVLGEQLCVGGDFSQAGGEEAHHLAMWDGTRWSPLGSGTDEPVHALASMYGIFLYAGGDFTQAGGVPARGVAEWFNGSWQACGPGLEGTVSTLTVFNGNLVAAGDFSIIDGWPSYRYVASFTGTIWQPLNTSLFINRGTASTLTEYDGRLVIGGHFDRVWYQTIAGSVGQLAGTRWLPLSFGMSLGDTLGTADIDVLFPYAGGLVAGGNYDRADAQLANNIAYYDGSVWTTMGIGVNGRVRACAEFEGYLVVGGEFTEAGGSPASYIAAWNGTQWMGDLVPVAVHDVLIDAYAERVRLRWQISPVVGSSIRSVRVQRGSAESGPFEDRSGELQPTLHMTWEDDLLGESQGQAVRWYRLLLDHHTGTQTTVGPFPVFAGSPSSAPPELVATVDPGPAMPVEIRYRLGKVGPVRLEIHDVRGRSVRVFALGSKDPGNYLQTWDRLDDSGHGVSRGVYFVTLQSGVMRSVRRLLLYSR